MKADIEIHKCVLCHNAPCNKKYKNIKPERIIRAAKFDNLEGARYLINDKENCFEKDESYNDVCPLNVNIDIIIKSIIDKGDNVDNIEDVDLSTEICGIKLVNPFILSSSIVGSKYEMCRRAFKQGWAGVATKTICMM